jgi:hypothetical protein
MSTTPSSIQDTFTWPNVRDKVANAAVSASDAFQDKLKQSLQGHDLPAMHDKVLSYVPSLSVPSMRRFGRSFDQLTGAVEDALSNRQSEEEFFDEHVIGDRFLFARYMGGKARKALVKQGICREWQIMASRENLGWQGKLDHALMQVFLAEKETCGVEQLFGMAQIWIGDVENGVWRLELDTDLLEVVAMEGSEEAGEKRICLPVDFALPEAVGSVRIRDVERETVDEEDWLAVE